MTTSSCPNSQSRSAAAKPAEPVPTTTVLALTTGTWWPAIVIVGAVSMSASGIGVPSWRCSAGRARRERVLVCQPIVRRIDPAVAARRAGMGSQAGDVHSAVDVDDLAGGVGHAAGSELHDGAGDVGRCAPPRDGGQPRGELLVVLLLYAGGHVGGDDSGPHLIDDDSLRGKACGPQLGRHGHARLGDAVLAAEIGRAHV